MEEERVLEEEWNTTDNELQPRNSVRSLDCGMSMFTSILTFVTPNNRDLHTLRRGIRNCGQAFTHYFC